MFAHCACVFPCNCETGHSRLKKTINETVSCHLFQVLDLHVEAVVDNIDLIVIHHNPLSNLIGLNLKNLMKKAFYRPIKSVDFIGR